MVFGKAHEAEKSLVFGKPKDRKRHWREVEKDWILRKKAGGECAGKPTEAFQKPSG